MKKALIETLLEMREEAGVEEPFVFLALKNEVCLMSFERIVKVVKRRGLKKDDVITIIVADLETADQILRILVRGDPDAADEFIGKPFVYRINKETLH